MSLFAQEWRLEEAVDIQGHNTQLQNEWDLQQTFKEWKFSHLSLSWLVPNNKESDTVLSIINQWNNNRAELTEEEDPKLYRYIPEQALLLK